MTHPKPNRRTRLTGRPNVWVVPRKEAFAVKFEGTRHDIVRGLTQYAAERIARSIAREFGTELLVQGENGQIRERDSHGNDPFPPRG